jgi:hypothetical protein
MRGNVHERLEYLRGEIRAERISYGELAELQGLTEFIDPSDTELLEWAGVPEFPEDAPAFGVDHLADGTPVGLWFQPGAIESDGYDRLTVGVEGLRVLREQIDAALTGW